MTEPIDPAEALQMSGSLVQVANTDVQGPVVHFALNRRFARAVLAF